MRCWKSEQDKSEDELKSKLGIHLNQGLKEEIDLDIDLLSFLNPK